MLDEVINFSSTYYQSNQNHICNLPTMQAPTASNQNSQVIFELDNNVGIIDPAAETLSCLDAAYKLLMSILYEKNKANIKYKRNNSILGLIKSIKPESLHVYSSITSTKIDATHSGFMAYLFEAWKKEAGVKLRPDVFFYTFISELINCIHDNPEKFRGIFTTKKDKQEINIVGLTVEKLMDRLSDLIENKEFFNIVTKTTFNTAPTHFNQVMGIAMANIGTPYFSYSTSKCGIPRVAVESSQDEWLKLVDALTAMHSIVAPICEASDFYIRTLIDRIKKLIEAAFVTKDASFFKDMFVYGVNGQCRSGHDEPVHLEGWARELYMGSYSRYAKMAYYEHLIERYNSHVNCLPYRNKDDPSNISYFVSITGMTSSYFEHGFLNPEYNIFHCNMTHSENEAIYISLAN